MNEERLRGDDLEGLLRRALADDLPPDVAAGMRERAERFRAKKAGAPRAAVAAGWLWRKRAWAALSVLMLVSGGLLQGFGSRSPLADRILIIGVREAVLAGLEQADSMTGFIRVESRPGTPTIVESEWRAGGAPDIQVVSGGEASEEALRTAAGLSTPDSLRALLSPDWRFEGIAGADGPRIAVYAIPARAGTASLRLKIDLDSRRLSALAPAAGGAGDEGVAGPWEARFSFNNKERRP